MDGSQSEGTTQIKSSNKLVHQAIDLSNAEDYTGALDLLTRAITCDPENAQAYFERGVVKMNLDSDADAVADFDRALAIDPNFPGAQDWRSRALHALRDHASAAEVLLQELQSNPEGPYAGMGVNPQKWADCAEAFIESGNHTKARELLEEYFERYACNVTSYALFETNPMRVLAKLLIQSGDFRRACEFARNAYSSKHQCPADVLTYALALESSGDLTAARRVCDEAFEINSEMHGLDALRKRLGD